jgi:hypothetical protein
MSKKIEQPKPETERRDHLTTTTKDGEIELTEEQLSRASGGLSLQKHFVKVSVIP